MNWDLVFAFIFYGFLFLFFLKHRKKFEVQNGIFALYRTSLGLKLMDFLGRRWIKFWKILGMVGVGAGFLGLFAIFYILIKGTYDLIFVPNAMPAVAPVLPGVTIPGLPTLGFWHWIIGIFIVAVIHEFGHGLYARVYNLKVKSSGFAFMGPILAAFVEPDEEQLKKASNKAQLSVFAAGPFFNLILFVIVFLSTILIVNPLLGSMMTVSGVTIYGLDEGYPLNLSGAKIGEEIVQINGVDVKDVTEFLNVTKTIKPNQEVQIKTLNNTYNLITVENPENKEKGYMGVIINYNKIIYDPQYGVLPYILAWISQLFFWLYVISFGIGLFNLLPLGPVDGGRMFYTASLFFIKDEKLAKKIWAYVGWFCLGLIVINLAPYLWKLLLWIIGLFG